jgi:hypothetical protein
MTSKTICKFFSNPYIPETSTNKRKIQCGIENLTIVAKETEINTIEILLRSISNAVAAAVGTTVAQATQKTSCHEQGH